MFKLPSIKAVEKILSSYAEDNFIENLNKIILLEIKENSIKLVCSHNTGPDYELYYLADEGKLTDNQMMVYLDENWNKLYSAQYVCSVMLSQMVKWIVGTQCKSTKE